MLWMGIDLVVLAIVYLATAAGFDRLRPLTNDVAGTKGLILFGVTFLVTGVLLVVW